MLRIVNRRSLLYLTSNHNRSLSSLTSATSSGNQALPPAAAAAASSSRPTIEANGNVPKKTSWVMGLLKFGVFGAFAGAAGTVGYATYAYTADEVDSKTKWFRDPTTYTVKDDASALEKYRALLYSKAMSVPAKSVDLYLELRRSIEERVQEFAEPAVDAILPDMAPAEDSMRVFTLVLDLSETLIYSDWKRERGWRTFKRPGVDAFLEHLAQFYEIVVYTDKPNLDADPIIQRLNPKGCIRHSLARTATKYQNGKHYRDLSRINRDPSRIIYVSGHALETTLQPENCIQIKPWKLEADDTALLDLIPFLECVGIRKPDDIRKTLASYEGQDIASEFIKRSQEAQKQKPKPGLGRIWKR